MALAGASRTPKRGAMSFEARAFLTIRVGKEPNHRDFLLHEGMVCGRSEFFRRAMNGDWAERSDRFVKFPEDEVEVFSAYTNLVYTNKIVTPEALFGEIPTMEKLRLEHDFLSKLYVLSEKLQDYRAKVHVLEAFLAVAQEKTAVVAWIVPGPVAVQTLYNGTPATSVARRLFVDLWTRTNVSSLSSHCRAMPHDFVCDLVLALHKLLYETGYDGRESKGTISLEEIIAKGAT